MRRIALSSAGLVLAMILVPAGAGASPHEEESAPSPYISPTDVKLTRKVSRVLFQVQAEERAEVEPQQAPEIEKSIRRLQRALERLSTPDVGVGVGITPPSRGQQMAAKRARVDAALTDLSTLRAQLAGRSQALAGGRQRAVVARTVRKLQSLEQDAQAVLDAPAEEQRDKSDQLAIRLETHRYGLADRPKADDTPTLRIAPAGPVLDIPAGTPPPSGSTRRGQSR